MLLQVFLDFEGRMVDANQFRESVFYHGVAPEVRSMAWKFLLGYFPASSTYSERDELVSSRRYPFLVCWAAIIICMSLGNA